MVLFRGRDDRSAQFEEGKVNFRLSSASGRGSTEDQ